MTVYEQNKKIVDKFEILSNKYHKMSLLFYELTKSLNYYAKKLNPSEFKKYIQGLGLDIKKITKITRGMSELKLEDLKI